MTILPHHYGHIGHCKVPTQVKAVMTIGARACRPVVGVHFAPFHGCSLSRARGFATLLWEQVYVPAVFLGRLVGSPTW